MRSKFESRVAKLLTKEGVKFEYEPFQIEYHSKVRGGFCGDCESKGVLKSQWYTPDFWIPGHDAIIETKGRFTSKDRTKMIDLVEAWPNYKFYMWFMTDNKIHKKSKTRYSDWCEANGISYHIGEEVPEWLDKIK